MERFSEGLQDLLDRKAGAADHAVGCAVVEGQRIAVDNVAVGEDDIAEETSAFVIGEVP